MAVDANIGPLNALDAPGDKARSPEVNASPATKSILKKSTPKDVFNSSPPGSTSPSSTVIYKAPAIPRTLSDFTILNLLTFTRHYVSTYLAKDRQTRKHVVITVIPKIEPQTNSDEERKERKAQYENVKNEQEVLKKISENGGLRFAVELFCSWHDTRNFYLVTQWNPTDLSVEITVRQRFTEDQARFYAIELILAIEGLRAKGIVHRDIKPSNIQLSQDGHIRLTGFAYAAQYDPTCGGFTEAQLDSPNYVITFNVDSNAVSGSFDIPVKQSGALVKPWSSKERCLGGCGSVYYQTPEQCRGEEYGRDVDLWAVGVVLFRMISGRMPFGNMYSQPIDIARSVIKELLVFKKTDNFSANAKDLMKGMLEKDQKKRMTLEDVKKHKFFAGVDWSILNPLSPTNSPLPLNLAPPIIPAIPFLPRVKLEPYPIKKGISYDAYTNPLPSFHFVSNGLERPRSMGAVQTPMVTIAPLSTPTDVKSMKKVGSWWKRFLTTTKTGSFKGRTQFVMQPRTIVFGAAVLPPLSVSSDASATPSASAPLSLNETVSSPSHTRRKYFSVTSSSDSDTSSPPTTPTPSPRTRGPGPAPTPWFVYVPCPQPPTEEGIRVAEEVKKREMEEIEQRMEETRKMILEKEMVRRKKMGMPSLRSSDDGADGLAPDSESSVYPPRLPAMSMTMGVDAIKEKKPSGLRPLILPTLVANNTSSSHPPERAASPSSCSSSSCSTSPISTTFSRTSTSSSTTTTAYNPSIRSETFTLAPTPSSISLVSTTPPPTCSPIGLGIGIGGFETELTQALIGCGKSKSTPQFGPRRVQAPSTTSSISESKMASSASTSEVKSGGVSMKNRLSRVVSWIKTSVSAPSVDDIRTGKTITHAKPKKEEGKPLRMNGTLVPRISIQDFDALVGGAIHASDR